MGWAPGPRITEADRTGDVRSLRRRLEDRLVLLVKGQGEVKGMLHRQLLIAQLRWGNEQSLSTGNSSKLGSAGETH